jgi:hypothetical protein
VGDVAVEGLAAADVIAREVERRLAGLHPFGDRLADPARGLDADRVEAGGNEKLRKDGASPRIHRPSGVKLSGPLKKVWSPMRFRIGRRSDASSSSRAR